MTVSWWIASALCETPLSSAAQESWGARARTPTATAMSVIHWRRVESRGGEDKVSGVFTIASIGSTAGSLQIFPQLMNANIKAKYDQRGYLLHATKRNRLRFDQARKRGRIDLHRLLSQAIEQFAARS